MDRIDVAYTAELRAQYMGNADLPPEQGGYNDLPPEHRPNRADRSDLGVLKDDDDVEMSDGSKGRVVCPGAGLGWFFVWTYQAMFGGWTLGQWEAQYIVDRAPANPAETPMPIFPTPNE